MNVLKSISNNDIELFQKIGSIADANTTKCYVIGGYVRDMLLGKHAKDVDFVCEGNGVEFAKKVHQSFNSASKLSIFKTYGTANFKVKDYELEFVGARKESYQQTSRNPIVAAGTMHDDFLRRDFTINAIAISLNSENFGELIDPFNGVNDLQMELIKTPCDPNLTFSDDPLRMLRAIRFAAQLNFTIAEETLESIAENSKRVEILTPERIAVELNKILLSVKPSKGLYLLDKTDLLDKILPELTNLKGIETRENISHKDNFIHTLQVLDNLAENSNDLWLRWAALLHDIAKPQTKRFKENLGWTFHGHEVKGVPIVAKIFKRLKLPLDDKLKFVQKMVRLHLRPIALTNEIVTDSAIRRLIVDAGNDLDYLMKLCKADITSKNEQKVKRYLANFERVEQAIEAVEEKDDLRNWKNPITGDHIMKTFNIKPGKIIGELKEEIKEAIMEGLIENNFAEAQKYLSKIAEKRDLGKK